jgi:hypothetical protein
MLSFKNTKYTVEGLYFIYMDGECAPTICTMLILTKALSFFPSLFMLLVQYRWIAPCCHLKIPNVQLKAIHRNSMKHGL